MDRDDTRNADLISKVDALLNKHRGAESSTAQPRPRSEAAFGGEGSSATAPHSESASERRRAHHASTSLMMKVR